MILKTRQFTLGLGLAVLCALALPPARGANTESAADKQKRLIGVLQSNAAPGEKAIACKQLAIYGTPEAVPALAPLLSNSDLASWARIALEVIPGPAPDKALREAAGKLQGRLLIGVINSIGARGDAKAVKVLAAKLKDSDGSVASAAAVALGRIGGNGSSKALRRALAKAPADVRPAVAEGCVRCAEKFLASGKASPAVTLYEAVCKAQVPKQYILGATRGLILAKKDKGIPLLVQDLRSPDRAVFGMALRVARELPGPAATKAVTTEFSQGTPDRQPLILLALAERNDPAALPTILQAAKSGSRKVQLVAVGVLDRLGDVSTLPVLLEVAGSTDNDLAQAAKAAIARLPGTEPDAELLKRFPASKGKARQVLIELVAMRRIEQALPAIASCAQDPDPAIRAAAVQTLGSIGNEKQIPELVSLLQKTSNAKDREDLEAGLLAISGRSGAACSGQLLPLARATDPALRIIGLHALTAAGGSDALAAVRSAVEDKDDTVQDEAVRLLSIWPNTWPEDEAVAEPLLALAKSSSNAKYQVLALRGYLQHVQLDKKLKPEEKVAKIQELLPLVQRPEEKRLAIAVLRETPASAGLEMLGTLAAEPGIADDACAAIVEMAAADKNGIARETRQKALQTAVDKATSDGTKKKAEAALQKLQ